MHAPLPACDLLPKSATHELARLLATPMAALSLAMRECAHPRRCCHAPHPTSQQSAQAPPRPSGGPQALRPPCRLRAAPLPAAWRPQVLLPPRQDQHCPAGAQPRVWAGGGRAAAGDQAGVRHQVIRTLPSSHAQLVRPLLWLVGGAGLGCTVRCCRCCCCPPPPPPPPPSSASAFLCPRHTQPTPPLADHPHSLPRPRHAGKDLATCKKEYLSRQRGAQAGRPLDDRKVGFFNASLANSRNAFPSSEARSPDGRCPPPPPRIYAGLALRSTPPSGTTRS
jgi:hypothetical protein